MRNILCFGLFSFIFGLQSYGQTYSKETILIQTNLGDLKLKLFEETPLHKANFLKLVKEAAYDSLLFHRVINNFMIQGGDPLSKKAKQGDSLGHGDLGYMVPAEFNEKLIHKKGRLCAARESDEINPEMASSASQFYIVMGRKRTMEELKKYEERINKTYYTKCARTFLASEQGKELSPLLQSLRSKAASSTFPVVSRAVTVASGTGTDDLIARTVPRKIWASARRGNAASAAATRAIGRSEREICRIWMERPGP